MPNTAKFYAQDLMTFYSEELMIDRKERKRQ